MTYTSVVTSAVQIAYHSPHTLLGECPRWDEQQQVLYWVDIDNNNLHCFDPTTGLNKTVTFREKIGGFSLREQGGFVLGMQSGFALLDGFNTQITYVGDPEKDLVTNRFNDGRCDPVGRFVAGTVNMDKSDCNAGIYQVSVQTLTTPTRLVHGLYTANGITFSTDGTTMYYSDTPRHIIYRGDYDIHTGTLSTVHIFQDFTATKGRPDGACIDAEGYYWVAMYDSGEVLRVCPQGHIVERVQLPVKHATMVAFGGADLKTAYATTATNGMSDQEKQQYPDAGSIFSFRTSVAGNVEQRFKG